MSDLSDIDQALRVAASLADRAYDQARRPDAARDAKTDIAIIRCAQAALSKLSADWPRLQALKGAADRAYDQHVARPRYEEDEPSGCSCHISAPCGHCTRQVDEDDADTHEVG